MKRPGWLDGGEKDDSGSEPEDDARPAKADRKGDGESAAERSARRVASREERGDAPSAARRKLADRVGKSDAEEKPKPKGEPRSKAESESKTKPTRNAKPGSERKAKREPKPEPTAGSKPKPEREKPARSKPKADETERKLNRPRRQPTSGKTAKDKDEERKERDKPERIRAGGKKVVEGGKRSKDDHDGKGGDGRRRDKGDGDRKRTRGDGPSAGKRARAGAVGFAGALKRGATDSRKWAAANGPKAGRTLLAGLGAVFALFFEVLGFVLNLLFAAWRIVARPVRAVLGAIDRAARAVSRLLTPARALTIVVAGAAILLALSQYADYRSISIGNGAYADVQSLAPAPETGRLQTGDPHSYVFVPVGVACLLLLAVATIGGRWRACRLIALAGFAAIVVALVVDRPAGLDPGDAALAFEGVKAKLIGGFYAQIAAGVLLIGSSSLLARELRLSGATKRVPSRRSERGEAKEPRLRRRAAGGGTGTEGTARA
ncbi:MAG: hypothetical protein U0R51_11230 [Solirubrobacterales bacterium]